MSTVDPHVDLGELARVVEPPPRRRLAWLVPLALALGFAAVVADTLRGRFARESEVTVVRPVPAGEVAGGPERAARLAVQAAGWIEPNPFPSYAPALAGGVVREVLVQESDAVGAGDVLALLVDDDARLALDAASAERDEARAELAAAAARSGIAAERFSAALEVTEGAARAAARLAAARADAEHRRAAVAEGEALVALAESELVVQRELASRSAAGPRQVEIAEAEVVAANARLDVYRGQAALAEATVLEADASDERARRELELRFADRLERDVAAAELDTATAAVATAEAAVAIAELALARTTVLAPADGVVLERLVAPGEALEAGAAVCSLWDPASLRVRVDVPQGTVGELFVGQRAEVLSESRAGRPYAGEVLRLVQRADIQKVTLEAQVGVADPDALLRPDMLVQVRFFGAGEMAAAGSVSDRPGDAVLVPRRVVEGGSVWVVDAEGRARQRAVETGDTRGDLVEVRTGLTLADKVIDGGRERVEDGTRVRSAGGAP